MAKIDELRNFIKVKIAGHPTVFVCEPDELKSLIQSVIEEREREAWMAGCREEYSGYTEFGNYELWQKEHGVKLQEGGEK
jgi:hypothetical protein